MSLVNELAACDVEDVRTGGLRAFVKLAWPRVFHSSPLQWNWHLDLLIDHYEACLRGEIRELVVNVPPGGSKSSITSVMLPAYGWATRPSSSWIFAAYGQHVVRRDAELWRTLLQSPWWARRWGHLFQLPTVPAIDMIKNNVGGWRLGTTPGGPVTGWHANYQVIDDPNKPEEMSKVGLTAVKDWMSRTMGSRWRRPPEVNSLICIMQRLHCDDLSAMLLERGAVHICLPAEFDPSRRTVTPWGSDPRTTQGELLDPVRLPAALIKELRVNLGGINASAQLDQNPVPEGGAVFKRDHLRYWSTDGQTVQDGVQGPDGKRYKCAERPRQFDQLICTWDMAFKDEETSDYVCGQVWGRVGSGFYLMDQRHGHFDFALSRKSVVELAINWPAATVKLVEDKANGTGIISTLSAVVPGIVPVDPQGGKFARASACSGLFEAGNVFLPDPKMSGYEWVDAKLIPELLSFPRAKHDDQVDAMTQGLLYLQANTSWLKPAMAKVRLLLGYVDID